MSSAITDLKKQGYTHAIFRHKILADTLTPVSVYQCLGQADKSYLLESVEGGEKWARFSVVGLPTDQWISAKDGIISYYKDGKLFESVNDNPFDYLQSFHKARKVANIPEELPFSGGLVGYFSYDSIAYIEKRLAGRSKKEVIHVPDLLLLISEAVIVMDNLRGEANILITMDLADENCEEKARQAVALIIEKLEKGNPQAILKLQEANISKFDPTYEMGEEGYKSAVRRIKKYIKAGDVMQVVPSQRMSIEYKHSALDLYRALRITNPSPYMYILNMGDHDIVGSSPEILVRVEDRTATVRPLAGTRKRGKTAAEDLALEQELLADKKERAEHAMLIDLGRNDLGRIAKPGRVKITKQMAVERYSHVMHIVSNVEAEVADQYDAIDVFKAAFPAGTLSGASKVRAMEIIDEVELSKRGIYGGAIGYWSWQGNMDLAIAIRTGVIQDQRLYVQAGSGIVYDSDPDAEWQETINKLGALIKAVSILTDQ